MKKIFIALLLLGFLSSYAFAEEVVPAAANDATKAAETKPVKKAKKKKKMKAEKKAKKAVKKETQDAAKDASKDATKEVKPQ